MSFLHYRRTYFWAFLLFQVGFSLPCSFGGVPEKMRGTPSGVCIWRAFPLARILWARPSSTKVFVGGLSYDTNETVLKDAFEQHGDIIEVKVICDHKSGRSKGYGFVQFTSETAANTALKEMDGQLLDGRNIRVHFAHK